MSDLAGTREPGSRRNFLGGAAVIGAAAAAGVTSLVDVVNAVPAGATTTTPIRSVFDITLPPYNATPSAAGAGINMAIADANGIGGGVVLIPPGTWITGRSIQMMNHVTLHGYSMNSSILKMNSAQLTPIVLNDQGGAAITGATVECLTIDGGVTTRPSGGANGISFDGTHGGSFCIFRDLIIQSIANVGIAMGVAGGGFTQILVENVYLKDLGTYGIDSNGSVSNGGVFLNNVNVDNYGIEMTGACMAVRVGMRTLMTDINVIGQVANGQYGVGFKEGSEYSVVSNYFMSLASGGTAFYDETSNPAGKVVFGPGLPNQG